MLISDRNNFLDELENNRLVAESLLTKKAELNANKTAVQERLANIVKQATGWTTLDTWAQEALDSVKNNKMIDLVKLDEDIAKWVASQGSN